MQETTPQLPKQKGKLPPKMILGLVGLLVLLVGAVAAYFLTQINQDIRQQAAGELYGLCTTSGATTCVDGFTYECISPGSPYVKIEPPEACSIFPPTNNDEVRWVIQAI